MYSFDSGVQTPNVSFNLTVTFKFWAAVRNTVGFKFSTSTAFDSSPYTKNIWYWEDHGSIWKWWKFVQKKSSIWKKKKLKKSQKS